MKNESLQCSLVWCSCSEHVYITEKDVRLARFVLERMKVKYNIYYLFFRRKKFFFKLLFLCYFVLMLFRTWMWHIKYQKALFIIKNTVKKLIQLAKWKSNSSSIWNKIFTYCMENVFIELLLNVVWYGNVFPLL